MTRRHAEAVLEDAFVLESSPDFDVTFLRQRTLDWNKLSKLLTDASIDVSKHPVFVRVKPYFPDYIHYPGCAPMISERMATALADAGLTGYRATRPCMVTANQQLRDDMYWMSIDGRCGPINDGLSVVGPMEIGGITLNLPAGLFVARASHDGSDFVVPQDTGLIFVTQRVVSALTAATVSGVLMTPVARALNTRAMFRDN